MLGQPTWVRDIKVICNLLEAKIVLEWHQFELMDPDFLKT